MKNRKRRIFYSLFDIDYSVIVKLTLVLVVVVEFNDDVDDRSRFSRCNFSIFDCRNADSRKFD